MREYMREYYWKRRREEPALKEFLGILEGGAEVTADNVYVSILRFLQSTSDGKSYGQIERAVDSGRILRRLKDLRRLGLVDYEGKRYSLTKKGRELCEYLFGED
jgi:DNA-binding HxlR family transcriptional regulator